MLLARPDRVMASDGAQVLLLRPGTVKHQLPEIEGTVYFTAGEAARRIHGSDGSHFNRPSLKECWLGVRVLASASGMDLTGVAAIGVENAGKA